MKFVDRCEELRQLDRLVSGGKGGLAVVWGRRRVGKTRLLLEWSRRCDGLYLACDESASAVQRDYIAKKIAIRFSGFDQVKYPDWRSLLDRLAEEARRAAWCGPLIMDELPYLAATSPEIASVLQRWVDHEAKAANMILALSGSSQRMMQGMVLSRSAPLFGRASVAMQIMPLMIGHMPQVFKCCDGRQSVKNYAAWGGIPRYWELAMEYGSDLDEAVDALVLNPLGVLHNEIDTLLSMEAPSANALRPLLDAIGLGAHRPSEIAGRIGQPVTSLSRPLGHLVEMGVIRRDTPFGESPHSTKRALYKIADPFTRLWFSMVAQYRSLLTEGGVDIRKKVWVDRKNAIFSMTWEDLCRSAVCRLASDCALAKYGPWSPSGRFWKGNGPEWDVVSVSLGKKHLLLGEVKWMESATTSRDVTRLFRDLKSKGRPDIPGVDKYRVVYAVFVPGFNGRKTISDDCFVVDANQVVAAL